MHAAPPLASPSLAPLLTQPHSNPNLCSPAVKAVVAVQRDYGRRDDRKQVGRQAQLGVQQGRHTGDPPSQRCLCWVCRPYLRR